MLFTGRGTSAAKLYVIHWTRRQANTDPTFRKDDKKPPPVVSARAAFGRLLRTALVKE